MKKSAIVLLVILLLSADGGKKQINVIFVNDFSPVKRTSGDYIGASLGVTVASTIANSSAIEVVTPESRKKGLNEIAFSQLGASENIILGRLLAADYVINGSYKESGDDLLIIADIYETSSQKIVDSFRVECNKKDSARGALKLGYNLALLLSKHGIIRNVPSDKPPYIPASDRAYLYFSLGLENYNRDLRVSHEYFRKAASSDTEYVDALIYAADTAAELALYDTAVDFLAEGEKLLNRKNGKYTVQNARLLRLRGWVYAKMEKYPAAVDSYNSSINILEYLGRGESSDAAESVSGLGYVYRKTGDLKKSGDRYRSAAGMLVRLGMESTLQYAEILTNMGALETALGNYEKALEHNDSSEKIKTGAGLKKSKSLALSISNRGVILFRMKRHGEAIKCFDKASGMYEFLDLEKTSEYAVSETNAGFCLSAAGMNGKAVKRLERAQSIRLKLGLDNTIEYADTALKLARCYGLEGQNCRGLELARKGAAVKKKNGKAGVVDDTLIAELEGMCAKE